MNQTAHVRVAAVMFDDRGKTVKRGVASVGGAPRKLDLDEDRFAVPGGSQLRTGEENHFSLRFAEGIEYGEPFFRHSFGHLRAEAEEQNPVPVVETQKDGCAEVGRQFIRVCIVPLFGRKTQFIGEFHADLHGVCGTGVAALYECVQFRAARQHFGDFAQAGDQGFFMLI